MKKRKVLAIALVLAMCMSAVAGCGGSSSSSSSTTTETTAAAAQEEASGDEAAEASESSGEAEFTWLLNSANTADHPAVIGLRHFADLVEERSNGRLKMEVFDNSTLGSERDTLEGMQMNTIQGATIVAASLAGFTDSFLVFELPFLFENSDQGRMVCDSEVGQTILDSLDEIGMKGLGFMEHGMRNITNSVRPIETPDDLKGIKIRTMENQIHMASFSALGADPTPMAFGELFTALQQHTIDAQENPLSVITSSKFYEVQDYLSITEHVYSATPLIVSKAAFEALPEDLQEIVVECGAEACAWERDYLDEVESQWIGEIEDYGCQVNYPDKAPFVEATKVVYDEFVGDGEGMVSPDILAQVFELIGRE